MLLNEILKLAQSVSKVGMKPTMMPCASGLHKVGCGQSPALTLPLPRLGSICPGGEARRELPAATLLLSPSHSALKRNLGPKCHGEEKVSAFTYNLLLRGPLPNASGELP